MNPLQNDIDAQVVVYANPFPRVPRLEVLIDWQDCVTDQPKAWPPKTWLDLLVDFTIRIAVSSTPPDWTATSTLPHCDLTYTRTFLLAAERRKYATFVKEVWEKTWSSMGKCASLKVPRNLTELVQTASANRKLLIYAAPHLSDHINVDHPQDLSAEDLQQMSDRVSEKFRLYVAPLLEWRRKLVPPGQNSGLGPRVTLADQPPPVEDQRRAALRRACRDELTVGHLFQALHFFDLASLSRECQDLLAQNKGEKLWLFANPIDAKGLKFLPIPTRLVANEASSLLTYLGVSDQIDYDGAWQSFIESFVGVRLLQAWDLPLGSAGGVRSAAVGHGAYTAGEILFQTRSVAHLTDLDIVRARAEAQAKHAKSPELKHQVDETVSAIASLESGKRPFDSIGITWDRSIEVASNDVLSNPVHSGFKGFRVDVKDLTTNQLMTLCSVDRRVVNDENREFKFTESGQLGATEGYVIVPLLKDPTVKDGLDCVIPRDFTTWDGYNLVARNPLDALAKIGKEPDNSTTGASASDPQNDVAIVLQDSANLVGSLNYGHTYQFGVRNVGLTEMSRPLSDENLNLEAWATLQFLRTVRIAIPELGVEVKNLTPVNPTVQVGLNSDTNSGELATTYKISVSSQRSSIEIRARSPLAHWKVGLHSRVKLDAENNEKFKRACYSFASRVLKSDNSDPRSARHTDYLTCVDPYVGRVRLISRVWYPFSKEDGTPGARGDRYRITGVEDSDTDNEGRPFTELIVQGEDSISTQGFTHNFTATVDPEGVPNHFETIGDPVIYGGYRNRLECCGVWSKDAKGKILPIALDGLSLDKAMNGGFEKVPEIDELLKGVDRWTANLLVFDDRHPQKFFIGGPEPPTPIVVDTLRYGGLKTIDYERWLQVPPTGAPKAGSGTPSDCDIANSPLARGTVTQWRKFVFTADQVAGDPRADYLQFIQRLVKPLKVISAAEGPSELSDPNALCVATDENCPNLTTMAFSFPASSRVMEQWIPVQGTAPKLRMVGVLGSFGGDVTSRRLPFVDDEIVWIVRLSWSVPLTATHPSRPKDLAATKEFRLYRTKRGDKPKLEFNKKTGEQPDKPVAVIPRPSDAALQYYDLDRVQWFWFDAIQSREGNQFDYHVLAVPEEPCAFDQHFWFLFEADIPNSQFDSRPDPVRTIPMFPVEGNRRMALFYPSETLDEPIKQSKKFPRVAIRAVAMRKDPLLSDDLTPPVPDQVTPSFYFGAGQASGTNLNLTELFPAQTSYDDADLKSVIFEQPEEVIDPYSYKDKGWIWADRYSGSKKQLIVTVDKVSPEALKAYNPFIKLQTVLYKLNKYPCLKHAAPSEVYETNWLQFYPDELEPLEVIQQSLIVVKPLRPQNVKGSRLLWYRFHFFFKDSSRADRTPFHLSTFYNDQPLLDLQVIRLELTKALDKFAPGYAPDHVEFEIMAEEGFLAGSYVLDPTTITGSKRSLERLFVTLRCTEKPRNVRLLSIWPGGIHLSRSAAH